MGIFSRTTSSERDRNELIEVQKQLRDLQREVEGAQRRIDAVDLHARAIVEEAKRLINKFERRLDREAVPGNGHPHIPQSLQDAPESTNPRAVAYDRPAMLRGGPKGRGNY